ncbi:hypothetical protein [Helicobacter sp. 23-1045]
MYKILRIAESKKNSCEAPKSRPLRGAKNREQGCSSATADFLLEAEKRGTPPKSEKAAAFWRVGGAGRGVQPFCEKESKSKSKNSDFIAESQNLKIDCHDFASQNLAMTKKMQKIAESATKSQNLNLDGCFASLTNPMDCHDSASQNLAMTENKLDSAVFIKLCLL